MFFKVNAMNGSTLSLRHVSSDLSENRLVRPFDATLNPSIFTTTITTDTKEIYQVYPTDVRQRSLPLTSPTLCVFAEVMDEKNTVKLLASYHRDQKLFPLFQVSARTTVYVVIGNTIEQCKDDMCQYINAQIIN